MSEAGWTPVLAFEALPDRRATRTELDGTQILLYRADERIFAIGNRCSHQGAPLDRGAVKVLDAQATVTCPAHGSVFSLADGRVRRGPATHPVQPFDARINDGMIELRPRA